MTMEALPPLKSPSGHDAYCHVCWEPVYRFWVDKQSPDHGACPVGNYTAQTCPNATGPARMRATIARLKGEGLWPVEPALRQATSGYGAAPAAECEKKDNP